MKKQTTTTATAREIELGSTIKGLRCFDMITMAMIIMMNFSLPIYIIYVLKDFHHSKKKLLKFVHVNELPEAKFRYISCRCH